MLKDRAAGILLAVSSLPSPGGIGSFGEAAREWLRFLKAAGQRYWQILPLGPTGWGDSPYQSFSAFAVSPYYIDLDTLAAEGLLTGGEIHGVNWGRRRDKTSYAALYRHREPLLRKAAERFNGGSGGGGGGGGPATAPAPCPGFEEFRERHRPWLEDYSLFMAIKRRQKGRPWMEWDEGLKLREEKALAKARRLLAGDIRYHSLVQYWAYRQWQDLHHYARSLGLEIIGDMPIYVAADSADAWANSRLFQLDEGRRPIRVAGCPPDPFSAEGQLWGNPLYRWDRIAETGYAWWLSRLRLSLELYDILRIDHFRGFESYYSIDAQAQDARKGEWVKGPGLDFIDTVNRELPGAAIIAEDLGYLTPEVKALLEASGYPGMKILQFAFDSREAGNYMPYTYGRNTVVYTGTHDNPTTLGWFKSAPPEDIKTAMDFFGLKTIRSGCPAFIRCALSSVANTAIIPLQDYLGLDNRARMNAPATLGGSNWCWRMHNGAASPALAETILKLTRMYGR